MYPLNFSAPRVGVKLKSGTTTIKNVFLSQHDGDKSRIQQHANGTRDFSLLLSLRSTRTSWYDDEFKVEFLRVEERGPIKKSDVYSDGNAYESVPGEI